MTGEAATVLRRINDVATPATRTHVQPVTRTIVHVGVVAEGVDNVPGVRAHYAEAASDESLLRERAAPAPAHTNTSMPASRSDRANPNPAGPFIGHAHLAR